MNLWLMILALDLPLGHLCCVLGQETTLIVHLSLMGNGKLSGKLGKMLGRGACDGQASLPGGVAILLSRFNLWKPGYVLSCLATGLLD